MYVFIKVTSDRAREIEQSTRDQANSTAWHEERRWRITASRFGDIALATDRRYREKLCQSLLNTPFFWSVATAHGKRYESVARNTFSRLFDIEVKPAGFFVCVERPWLGASPDGIIDNDRIIEIKT